MLGPFPPPLRALARGSRLLRLGGPRSATPPVAERRSRPSAPRALFAGVAAHSVLPLERRPSAGFGLALGVLGHVAGWGFPRGGAQAIADGLVGELGGSAARCTRAARSRSCPRRGRARRRRARELRRSRGSPRATSGRSAATATAPARSSSTGRSTGRSRGARRSARRAATVHLGGTLDEIAASDAGAWSGRPAERPFVILAQHTPFDPSRAPAGKHTAWAYCHVPNGWRGDMTERVEAQVERFAPGFRDLVLARAVRRRRTSRRGTATSSAATSTAATPTSAGCWARPVRALNRTGRRAWRLPLLGRDAARRRRARDVRLFGGAVALRDGSRRDR